MPLLDIFSLEQLPTIPYTQIQNVTADRILGRLTTSGSIQELTAAQVRTLLNVTEGGVVGLGTTNYLAKFTGSGTIGNSAVFESGGNVGIGTTSPNSKIHSLTSLTVSPNWEKHQIWGNTVASDYYLSIEANWTASGIRHKLSHVFGGVERHNIVFNYNDDMIFGVGENAPERMRITSTGNVGIGTAAPISLGSGTIGITVDGSSGGFLHSRYNGLNVGYFLAQPSSLTINTFTGYDLAIGTEAVPRLTIKASSGNVLIGTTSDSGHRLNVNGEARIQTINNLGVSATSVLVDSATGVISKRTVSELRTDIGAIGGSGTTNYLSKFTGSGTIGDSQIFDNGSNILVNITSPVVNYGKELVLSNTSGGEPESFFVANGNRSFEDGNVAAFVGANNSNIITAITSARGNTANSGVLKFFVYDSGSGIERMRISQTGNILIGTTSDSGHRLNVNGQIKAESNSNSLISITGTANYPGVFQYLNPDTNPLFTSNGTIRLLNSNSTNNNFTSIDSYTSSGDVVGRIAFITTDHTNNVSDIAFITRSGGSFPRVMTLTSSGNVGIGTTTPFGKLSVQTNSGSAGVGSWNNSYAIFGPNVSSQIGAALGLSYNNTGDFAEIISLAPNVAWKPLHIISDGLIFKSAGSGEAARITSSGNVGIGTTNPTHRLHVNGAIRVLNGAWNSVTSGGFGNIGFSPGKIGSTTFGGLFGPSITYNAYLDGSVWRSIGGGHASAIVIDEGIFSFANSQGVGSADVALSWTDRLVINTSGNVGIGTTSPSTLLHIDKSSSSNNVTGTPSIIISNRDSTSGTFIGGGIFNNSYRDVSLSSITAGIWFENQNSVAAGALAKQSALVFGANSYLENWNTPTERMRITAEGNVGIGTNAPNDKFEVYGGLIWNTNNVNAGLILRTGNASSSGANIELNSGDLTFVSRTTVNTERLRITSGGNVLIGTTSDSGQRLQVSGNALVTGTLEVDTVNNGTGDFVTLTAGGILTKRTAAEVRGDIGAQAQLNGTGFVKVSGTTVSYDNSTYYLASNPNGYTSNTGTVTNIATGTGLTGGPITGTGTISLSHLGIQSLTDPNADRIFFWDDSAGSTQWLNWGNGVTINGTTLQFDTVFGDGRYYLASNPNGYTSNSGTVTQVTGTGGYGGLTLSGTVNTSGNITLGGTPTGTWPISISGNADTVDSFHASQSTIANGIVVRDGSGYIFGNYLNMTDDGNPGVGTAISSFITKQGDNYYRSVSPTNAMVSIRSVASGTWPISVSGFSGATASGAIADLNAAWTAPGTSISNAFYVFRYDTTATNKPVAINNANWLINIYSHPTGGTASYGHQLAAGDADTIYSRTVSNGSFGGWRALLNTTNATLQVITDIGNTTTNAIAVRRLTITNTSGNWFDIRATNLVHNYGSFLKTDGTAGAYIGFDAGGIVGGGSGNNFGLRSEADLILMSGAAERVRLGSGGLVDLISTTTGGLRLRNSLDRAHSWFPFTNGTAYISSYTPAGGTACLIVRSDDGTNYTERFIVNNNGNVLIGTTSDSGDRLRVFGGNLRVDGEGRFTGDVIAYYSSDRRLKDNLTIISSPLEKLSKINGYTFDWNSKQETYRGRDYGVIAQEIESIFPELVRTRDSGYKAVKYEKLIPVLIEAIKELKTELDILKNNGS